MGKKDIPATSPLLDEFQVPSPGEWRAEVERLLKGAPFAKKMFTTTLEGIQVGSMATAADRPDPDWTDTLPGQAPFLRGINPGNQSAGTWLVAQELQAPSVAEFNAAVRHDLERGQTAVNLIVSGAGPRGTGVSGLDDLRTALEGVDLAATPIFIQAGAAHRTVAEDLWTLAGERGLDPTLLRGRLGCDPVAGMAVEGALPVPATQLYDELAALARRAAAEAPGLRTLPVFEDPWHDGGADGALGLGLTLAAAVTALREMEARGLTVEEAAARVHFNLCIGTDFFLEIARLRALRVLWTRVLAACGCDPAIAGANAGATVHARTSRRTGTRLDPHVNMLRATTQAMSAVLGGVDSLSVAPFDEAAGLPDGFSRRIARNVQLILAHECHLDHVTDPAGGSWYVEKLTAEVAARTWEHFQAVEAAGGMMDALATGRIQEWVAEAAAARAVRLATRREVLVGTNQYPDPNPLPPPEISAPETVGPAIPLRRDGAPFETLRAGIEARAKVDAPACRVYCACLGDVARYMPRLEFVRRFFRVGGFEVTGERFGTTAAEVVAAARADGARTVILVGLDETYAEMAEPVVAALQQGDDPPVVMLAGQPGEYAGIEEYINIKSNVLDVLGRLFDKVGGGS
ncbi:MAG: methylmalonyl-CoA mutase family protein [Candidatus Krumholzibacteriota bacterium]